MYNMYVHTYIEPSKPEHLTVHKDMITETTITLSWKEPNLLDVPDPLYVPITGYEVQYGKGDKEFKKVEKSEDLTYKVTGLVAHTEYQFRVAAINAAGHGPFTDVVTQFTSESCGYVHSYMFVLIFKVCTHKQAFLCSWQ